MANKDAFEKIVKEAFTFKGESFKIGTAMLDGTPLT